MSSLKSPKVVLVTGGSSGIGLSICKYLAELGYRVYGTSRKAKPGTKLENFELVGLDVNDPVTISSAVDYVIAKEGQLDVLINNAGLGIIGSLEETSLESIRTIFDTNVTGAIAVTQAVLPHLRKQKQGTIINISSIGGLIGLPYRSIYSASKFAVEGWSEALSLEVKRFGVNVVILEPGDFKTNISASREITLVENGSPYQEEFDRIHHQINEEVSEAADPVQVAEVVHKILRSSSPRLRYKVGTRVQKLSVWIKKFLPGRLFEGIISNHYKLKK